MRSLNYPQERYLVIRSVSVSDTLLQSIAMEDLRQELLKLQGQHRILLTERKRVLQALESLRKTQKYISGCTVQNPAPSHQDQIGSKTSLPGQPRKRHSNHEASTKPQSVIQEKLQEKQKQRNKRTFGVVAQHLMKAKVNLKNDEEKLRKKEQVERQILEKQEQRDRQLREDKRATVNAQKEKLLQRKVAIAKQLLDLENEVLLCKYRWYLKSLEGFATKTRPVLFWKPIKGQNNWGIQQEETKAFLHAKLQATSKDILEVSDPELHVNRINQDEVQYYQGLLLTHLKAQLPGIMTRVEPHIFWNTVKTDPQIQELQARTSERLLKQTDQLLAPIPSKQPESEDQASQSQAHPQRLEQK